MIRCRVCHANNWAPVLSLGATPLANHYLRTEDLAKEEVYYPLNVIRCLDCGLVSLDVIIDPRILYDEYSYLSSESKTMLGHNRWLAQMLCERLGLVPQDLVVEIGSNTGVQLRAFKQLGVQVLGVEPAANIARMANAAGLETLQQFFSSACAREVVSHYGRARVILGRHVFAHIDDLDDVLRGVDALLEPDGVLAIEMPYLVNLVEGNQFDTIYHEHLSYFCIGTLQRLFEHHGMELFGVEQLSIHGGSILILVKRKASSRFAVRGVTELLALEETRGFRTGRALAEFAQRVVDLKLQLVEMVTRLKREGRHLAGYGATAKGNTLLNYCGIGTTYLDYVTDTTSTKQGRYLPGTRIPVRPEAYARECPVDDVLLLAWNYTEEILEKEHKFLERGGRFLVPIPVPRMVGRTTAKRQSTWATQRSHLARSTA